MRMVDSRRMHVTSVEKQKPTSSFSLSARAFSPSANCLCSAARALDNRTSNSFERITHSKCRSRNSYKRKTSFSLSRTLSEEMLTRLVQITNYNVHSIENFLYRAFGSEGFHISHRNARRFVYLLLRVIGPILLQFFAIRLHPIMLSEQNQRSTHSRVPLRV